MTRPHHRTTPADMAQAPDADVLTAAIHQDLPQRVRADRRHRRPATTPPAQSAVLDQPGDLMPVDVIGLGLRRRPGDPQTRELGHPPLLHQTLTVADGFVAGLHRSCRQPGWSSEHHAGKGEVSSHEACDLGADDTEGNMRRSGTGGAHGLQPTVCPRTTRCSIAANILSNTQIDPSVR
jgi:hypothetical protein